MLIKLLSKGTFFWALLLTSTMGWGQECPTSVSISADTGNTICAGTKVTFTANANGGSGTFNYQWKIDGINAGTNSNQFPTSSLENGDKVTVTITSAGATSCNISSSSYTMTVNANRTPTVSVSANKNSICPGESVTFTATNTNGGTNPQYTFYLNEQTSALQSGSSNTYSTTSLTNGDRIRVVLKSNLECVTSDTAQGYSGSITVRAGTPAVPGTISGTAAVCPGTSQTYSINAVAGATSYQWTLPSGWSGSSTSTSINITAGTSNGTISVKAINDCGTSEAQSLTITIKAGTPAVPGTITGKASVCPGVAETYSVAAVSGATEYIWTLPNGWTGTSSTNSITVDTGASGSGNISVQAKNDCGTSTAKTLAVSVKPGSPSTPGTISGTSAVCPGVSQTYSVPTVTGATSYIWTLPNGWTGTSTTNSITVTSGTTGGNISVKATNDCGTSTEQNLAVTVKPGTPATPGAVSGSNLVCPGTSETYSVPPVNGATEYLWTLPSGWTGTSTTETITVTTAQSGNGNITVKAVNDCGTSPAVSIAVSVDKPAPVMSGTITGPAEVCSTATGLVYTIPAITNATEYLWTLPGGWSGTSTTNSITVNASSNSGNISVIAKNTCGESAASANLVVNSITGVPSTPETIKAPNLPTNAICPPATGIQFNVPEVTGADNYLWTLPSGWEITSGSGTNSIVVRVNATAATTNNASVSVEAVNICGNSTKSTLSGIAIDSHVNTNAGTDQTVCKLIAAIDIVGDYSFSGTNKNLKPTWSVGTGLGSFGDPSKLTTTFTPSQAALDAGSVILTLTTDAPSGACGPGKDEMKITFKPLPTATITATSPVCNGNTSTLTFTGTPNSRVTYRLPNNTTQAIDIPSSGTINVPTAALTANSTYSLVSSINLDTPACTNTFSTSASTTVTVTPKPTASISYAGPFCGSLSTSQPVTLTGTHAYTGGVFSSTEGLAIDPSSGAITPGGSTPGTYIVSYNTPEAGDCAEVTASTEVTITKAPTATISYTDSPFCTSDASAQPVTLTGTDGFSGGTFTAPAGLEIDPNTGAITPGSSSAGIYTVTYQTPAAGGCSPVPATTEVKITKEPTVTISYPEGPFCLSDTSLKTVTLIGTDAYSGGTYSAPAGLSINSSNGEINPSASTVGTYTITYNSPATSGCGEVTATTEVTITQTPTAEISYAGPYCTSDATANLPEFTNTAGAYEGGTFRSTPEGLSVDPTTGAINAENSSPNTYTVFYQLPAGAGCGTSEIETKVTITQVPQLEMSYTTPLCTSDTTSYLAIFSSNAVGAYQNGNFTATSGLAIDSEGNIIAANSTPGIHTITYTTPDANGCGPVVVTTDVEIFEQASITTQPVNIGICSTEPASFEVVASGSNLTYQWKRVDGAAITNATGVNTAKLSFSNATATNAGEYFVEVSGSSPCGVVSSDPVTLNIDENIVIIKPTEDEEFCDQEKADVTFEFVAHAKGTPLTFTWIKDGADIPGTNTERYIFAVSEPVGENGEYTGTFKIVNPNPADNGVYAVRINGPDYFTCSEATSKTFTLNVTPLPEPPTTQPVVLCQGETAGPLSASGVTGATFKWYDASMQLIEGVPTPSTVEAGNTSYFVTQTTEVCESAPTELIVTVNPTPALPTTQEVINYCFEEADIPALSATGTDTNAVINWYGPNDPSIELTTAPIPVTTSTGNTKYWVSQSIGECESDLVEIIITIDPLPELAVSADSSLICQGSSTILHATGADSYTWSLNGTEIGTTAEYEVTPDQTTTYTLTGTNSAGCVNTTEITIEVDVPTVPGTITGPESVCISSPSGIFNLADYTGEIKRWEKSEDGGATWTEIAATSESYEFTGLATATSFRAIVKNGVCEELPSNQIDVTIDPLPVGGELAFAGNGRVFTICENPVGNYAVDLNLTGMVGEIVRWGYRSWDATGYTTLNIGGEVFTGNTLTAAQIQALGFSETTVFQVEISSGTCAGPAYSKTAILTVIPSDITPTPVTVDPEVVCLGEEVTLSSETGYETGGTILDQGAFDNASITNHGWRIRREGISGDLGFDTDANNTEFDRWKRATPRAFTTASINSPYNTSGVVFDTGIEDGNKGFALISGNYRSTMETPIFTIGSMDQAILTFDQAYVLTPGSFLKVEISTDGGNTYTTLYIREVPADASKGIQSGNFRSFGTGTVDTHPENKIIIDLGDYIGRPNLRIRFNYSGAKSGNIWAVDNIDIPEGPGGVTMEWRDYTNPEVPEGLFIGTNNSEKYIPTKIGLNVFEVKTKLIYNSKGDACEVAENAERIEVFVFDKYTTSVTAGFGSCGDLSAQLNAVVINGTNDTIRTYPTPDGYIGRWEITGGGTLVDSDPDDGISAVNDPNATLSVPATGTYHVSWILEPTEVDESGNLYINPEACPPVVNQLEVNIEGCIALDFDGQDDYVDLGPTYNGDYSLEAWVKPTSEGGTVISGPQFNVTAPSSLTIGQWSHIAVTGGQLYINGIPIGSATTGTGGERALIGARWVDGAATDFFHGWIEEVRIWNTPISQDQIRFMMNQRLIRNGAQMGEQIPMDVPGGLTYTNLAGYYRLISAIPDPANLVTFDEALKPLNGVTIDLAVNPVPGVLKNMETNQQNTAPLPYFSGSNSAWDTAGTWARPDVWKIPATDAIEWNIVRTSHNIDANREIKLLGLISEVNTLNMEGTNPNSWTTGGTGNPLHISHYLLLDGIIDLNGESQLLQPMGSIVDGGSTGHLDRDQQGTQSSYNYNYWSSPVSGSGDSYNSQYTVGGVLMDGTLPSPQGIVFGPEYHWADNYAGSNRISTYWLYKFHGTANNYMEWSWIGKDIALAVGEGFSMKGTLGSAAILDSQNYTFRGLPNNGDIIPGSTGPAQNYLVGNPYPSAIDANKFIKDNLTMQGPANVFNGTIYFWSHFANKTHYLEQYVGGYAAYNLSGGVRAVANDERINATGEKGGQMPQQFIPVGQAFFLTTVMDEALAEALAEDPIANNSVGGGEVIFKNSQRVYKEEDGGSTGGSVFHSANNKNNDLNLVSNDEVEPEQSKIWLKFKSPMGYHRQILVTADENASDNFDLGYDAPLIEDNEEDMYWFFSDYEFVIQGVADFNLDRELQLGVKVSKKGALTISIDELYNVPADMNIFLEDSLKQVVHDLRERDYHTTSEEGVFTDRFKIVFIDKTVVEPVEPPVIEIGDFEILYVNGTREILVRNPKLIQIKSIFLSNLMGQQIMKFYDIPVQEEVRLPVKRFSSGVYIIKVHAENGINTKKVILE